MERFLARARRLGDTLGPILSQLPPRWPANPVRVEQFAVLLPTDLTHLFEFRAPRWFVRSVREVLERHSRNCCTFDMPGLTSPLWVTGNVVYFRFHGCGDIYASRYGREGLQPWG